MRSFSGRLARAVARSPSMTLTGSMLARSFSGFSTSYDPLRLLSSQALPDKALETDLKLKRAEFAEKLQGHAKEISEMVVYHQRVEAKEYYDNGSCEAEYRSYSWSVQKSLDEIEKEQNESAKDAFHDSRSQVIYSSVGGENYEDVARLVTEADDVAQVLDLMTPLKLVNLFTQSITFSAFKSAEYRRHLQDSSERFDITKYFEADEDSDYEELAEEPFNLSALSYECDRQRMQVNQAVCSYVQTCPPERKKEFLQALRVELGCLSGPIGKSENLLPEALRSGMMDAAYLIKDCRGKDGINYRRFVGDGFCYVAHDIAASKDIEDLEFFLANSSPADLRVKDSKDIPPVEYAITSNANIDSVLRLIELLDVEDLDWKDLSGRGLVEVALSRNFNETYDMHIDLGEKARSEGGVSSVKFTAAPEGDAEMVTLVRALLEKGVKMDKSQILRRLSEQEIKPGEEHKSNRQLDLAQLFIDHGASLENHHALVTCIANNNMELFHLLLERGMDPNGVVHNGATFLCFAIYFGNIEVVNDLLAAGAKLDFEVTEGFRVDFMPEIEEGFKIDDVIKVARGDSGPQIQEIIDRARIKADQKEEGPSILADDHDDLTLREKYDEFFKQLVESRRRAGKEGRQLNAEELSALKARLTGLEGFKYDAILDDPALWLFCDIAHNSSDIDPALALLNSWSQDPKKRTRISPALDNIPPAKVAAIFCDALTYDCEKADIVSFGRELFEYLNESCSPQKKSDILQFISFSNEHHNLGLADKSYQRSFVSKAQEFGDDGLEVLKILALAESVGVDLGADDKDPSTRPSNPDLTHIRSKGMYLGGTNR